MHGETDFLTALLANPDDDTARLVYADWLDEQADAPSLAKAEYLRRDVELHEAGGTETEAGEILVLLLRGLAERVPAEWRADVSRVRIEKCDVAFVLVCPRRWEQLRTTDDPAVRSCDVCRKPVHYCDNMEVARRHAGDGHCVALDLRVERHSGDLTIVSYDTHTLGELVTYRKPPFGPPPPPGPPPVRKLSPPPAG